MTDKPARWITLAVFVKLLYLAFIGEGRPNAGGDSFSYIGSVDNLVEHGVYTYALDHLPAFAGRMPGYAVLYLPFRWLFSAEAAALATSVAQAVLDGGATFALACLAKRISGSRPVSVAVFVLALISAQVSSWNHRLLTESPFTSSAVFGTALLARALDTGRRRDFLTAGALFCWCVFLKPISIVPITIAIGFCGASLPRHAWGNVLLLTAPFMVTESVWIIRNAVVLKAFIPAQYDENAGYVYNPSFLSLVDFVKDFGGDYVAWNPEAEIRWFDEMAGMTRTAAPAHEPPRDLPPALASTGVSRSQLIETRILVRAARDSTLTDDARALADQNAVDRLQRHRAQYRGEHPFGYHVVAPLRLAVKYLLHSGTTTLFAERYRDLSASRKLFKVLQSGIYLLSVLVGIPAAVWALIGGAGRASNRAGLVPCIFVLFFLLAYPLLMRRVEYRYAIPAHPFALLLGCSVVVRRKP